MTEGLSKACQVRVIWGGDATVTRLRSVPLAPNATEVVFADRFSVCMIDAQAVLNLDETGRQALAHNFYNDAFWFDQMACSSPRLIMWHGDDNTTTKAQAQFWSDLESYLNKRAWAVEPSTNIGRMTAACALAARGQATSASGFTCAAPSRTTIDRIDESMRESHPGGGMFLELRIDDIAQALTQLSPRDQTLSIFGISHDELLPALRSSQTRGVDRIVPVGEALAFGPVWDGYDLLEQFTRRVAVKA